MNDKTEDKDLLPLRALHHYLNQSPFPVLHEEAHLLRKRWAVESRAVIISDFDGNLKFKCFLHLHIGSRIFWYGSYSTSQLVFLHRVLAPAMVYVDIGANVGEQTVFAAKRLQGGRVIAFEPTNAMYQCLIENIRLNGFQNVKALKLGLGNQTAKLPIYGGDHLSSDADGTSNEGVPTLYPSKERNKLLEEVDIVRFDDFVPQLNLERLDVMKIDVEGAEMDVLKGAERTIRRFRPIIIMEVHEGTSQSAGHPARALLECVANFGYRIEGLVSDGTTQPFDINNLNTVLSVVRDVVCYPS